MKYATSVSLFSVADREHVNDSQNKMKCITLSVPTLPSLVTDRTSTTGRIMSSRC